MSSGFNGITGFNALTGFNGFSGFNGFPGAGNPPVRIPEGALLYYVYSQPNLDSAITEQVNKQNQILTERDSDINIEQSNGTIETFGPGVAAFDRGVNMQVWDGSTNVLSFSSDLSQWSTFTQGEGVPAVIMTGYEAPDGTATATRVILDIGSGALISDRAYLRVACQVISAGLDQTMSFKAKSFTGDTYTLDVNPTETTDINLESVTNEWRDIEATSVSTGNSTGGIQLRGTFGTSNYVDILVWTSENKGFQTEQSSFATPFIYTSGGPATRAPTSSQASTFIEDGLWVDSPSDDGGANPFRVGDLTDGGDFVNGINEVGSAIALTADGGGVASKYFGLRSLSMVGSGIYTSSGSKLTITGLFAGSSLAARLDRGQWTDFEYPNELIFDFTQSDYFTGNLAADTLAIRTLRINAGDNGPQLDALGTPALIPANSRIGYPKGLSLQSPIANMVLWESGTNKLFWDGANVVADINGTTASSPLADISTLDSAYWEYDGANLYVRVNGVLSAGTASAAPVFTNFIQIGSDVSLANFANGGYAELLVQPFTDTPP